MRKLKIILITLLSLFPFIVEAQIYNEKFSRNSLIVEGSTIIWAHQFFVNYEYRIVSIARSRLNFIGQAGLGINVDGHSYFSVGPRLNLGFFTGSGKHHFEMLMGYFPNSYGIIYRSELSVDAVYPHLSLGYRYQKPYQSSIFRVYGGITGIGVGWGKTF